VLGCATAAPSVACSPLRLDEEGGTGMASSGKQKTTFSKLARESKLRERRLEKQAKKDARKRASENQPPQLTDTPAAEQR
jgi:hypothetical protein